MEDRQAGENDHTRRDSPLAICVCKSRQYATFEFAKFAEEKGFTHITSSPRYPQSNGKVERAVQTVKTRYSSAHHGQTVAVLPACDGFCAIATVG